jgi:GT2 family glycosyltransferase
MSILALVVSYKIKLDCSETLLSLAEQSYADGLQVFVWDNSPEEAGVENKLWLSRQFRDVHYYHDGQNTPLSDLYNHVIEKCLRGSTRGYEYLMLFDQDSVLERDFLLKMVEAATRNPQVKLLLPLVRSGANRQLVSPANLYYFKGSTWKNPRLGLVKTRFTTAINSGMMISVDYLVNEFIGYPREIPFYGTDNWFCQTVAKNYRWLYVVDTTIKHDLAQFGSEPKDIKLWRHRQNVRAVRFLNRDGFFRRNLCLVYTFTTCVRRAIRYRDWRFLQ